MLVNLSYGEMLQIVSALSTIENVYGQGNTVELQSKLNSAMEYMDNAPLTEIYPGICQGVGTVST